MKTRAKKVIVLVLIVAAVAVSWFLWRAWQRTPGPLDSFANCLDERGAVFYGAFWCPHCQDQKKDFGRSKRLLPYVECSLPNRNPTQICLEKQIEGYPTWEFSDGSREVGTLSLERLSERTGCVLPDTT